MDLDKLDRTIKRFWETKHRNDIYYLGRCADVSYAINKFLGGKGQIYTVGGDNKTIVWHTILKVGDYYFDIRGKQDINQVLRHNPIVLSKSSIQPAGPNEIAHIEKLLNHQFVQDTIDGLKKAEKEV